jgi:hypothetical protein
MIDPENWPWWLKLFAFAKARRSTDRSRQIVVRGWGLLNSNSRRNWKLAGKTGDSLFQRKAQQLRRF